MAAGTLQLEALPIQAEESFFSAYRWCLNPMLSLRELLQCLAEEIERYRAGGAAGWQGEERRINLYLFTCAIACTLDDYLAPRRAASSEIARRVPGARAALRAAESFRIPPRRAAAWRQQWTPCVDAACDLLLTGRDTDFFAQVRALLLSASSALGESAERQRMRIPEAFRCQDLTHQDVCSMVRLCLPSLPDRDRPIAIIGPRTAGAYFAPLAASYLRSMGYTRVVWQTVRPKHGFSRAESRAIAAQIRAGAELLIIDDHPNSGHTLRILFGALRSLGARDVVVALPGHPSIPDFALPGVDLHLLPPEDRHKVHILSTEWTSTYDEPGGARPRRAALPLLATPGGTGFRLSQTAALNEAFAAHYSDGFQVRLKRVIDRPDGTRIMAKSTGWGWLGYHAWLAATALQGFVPQPIRLRDGILYSEFIDASSLTSTEADPETFAAYLARRVLTLPLSEDPAFDTLNYRWCGWDDLIAQLARIYGPFAPLKKRAIRRALRSCIAPKPTLIDGRMKPADWLRTEYGPIKTDFEHHNFGGGEPDIVDPAWDLASAIYEFDLAPESEHAMLRAYVAETSDVGAHDRLPLYKILYAMSQLRAAKYWLARRPNDPRRVEWNRQYTASRSFAAFHTARYCGRHLGPPPTAWERRLFFLDLDGVLDWGLLGFPHTSQCGVQALDLLRRNRYSVVLNTARSLDHVREYCRAYKLPGGVAEHGSVFYDAVRDWEVPLVDAEAATEIDRLRNEIQNLPGVFIDPENRYSIRAYRIHDGYMRPLADAEVHEAIRRAAATRLAVIQSSADTYIVEQGAGKAPAMASVQAYLGCAGAPLAAMGDSRQDVDMLRAADIAFAPANASREVRDLVARGECRRTSRALQAGLLEAAADLCLSAGSDLPDLASPAHAEPDTLLDTLLQVPDRCLAGRIFHTPRWGRV